ncbi:MAG: hypothetical protein KC505_05750 [Myxococcales bacterium]|nr:hypothetical protein [Myxococcales bacterium]
MFLNLFFPNLIFLASIHALGIYNAGMTQIPTFSQLLKQAIENRLLELHTAMVGRIERYDAVTQTADIQPVLKNSVKSEPLPLLCDIPVLFPRAGDFFISLPLKKGDFVQVLFNELSIDEFFTESPPVIDCSERFTLQGAVAFPGLFSQTKALKSAHKDNLVLGKEQGVQVHITQDTIKLGSEDAREALAIASKVRSELEYIKSKFNTHSHTGPMGPVKPSDAILSKEDIATKNVVAS